jgi:hypothetical protein
MTAGNTALGRLDSPMIHRCRPLSPPGCLRRIHAPPNPTFSLRLRAECRGLPVPPPAERARRRTLDLAAAWRFMNARCRTQPANPFDLLANPRATCRCEATRGAVLAMVRHCRTSTAAAGAGRAANLRCYAWLSSGRIDGTGPWAVAHHGTVARGGGDLGTLSFVLLADWRVMVLSESARDPRRKL